jgi:hypothetical protein
MISRLPLAVLGRRCVGFHGRTLANRSAASARKRCEDRRMGIFRRSVVCLPLALCMALLVPGGGQAAVKLHSCDLGAARPLRCGHITVPLRRADPALGTTRIGFAVRPRGDRSRRSLGTIFAVDGGPGYASTAAPYVRSFAAALAPLLRRRDVVSSTSVAPAARTPSIAVPCSAARSRKRSRSASAPISSG